MEIGLTKRYQVTLIKNPPKHLRGIELPAVLGVAYGEDIPAAIQDAIEVYDLEPDSELALELTSQGVEDYQELTDESDPCFRIILQFSERDAAQDGRLAGILAVVEQLADENPDALIDIRD